MKTLEPLINELVRLIQNGVNFVQGQLPEVAQQILAFKQIEAVVFLAIHLVVLLAFATVLGIGIYKIHKRGRTPDEDWLGPITVCCGFGTVVSAMAALFQVPDYVTTLLKIHYAPKLYLIEFLKEFLR